MSEETLRKAGGKGKHRKEEERRGGKIIDGNEERKGESESQMAGTQKGKSKHRSAKNKGGK